MPSYNHIVIMGHLGQDPELRYTQSQKAVCNLSIATTDKYGDKEETTWHKVVVWGTQAENCQKYLKKGDCVFVQGRLTKDYWEKDGQKHEAAKIQTHTITFVTKKSEKQPAAAEARPPF